MTTRRRGAAALLGVALALALWGCEDTDPAAPEGSTIILSANPTNISEDQLDPEGRGESQITAVVLDQNSIPLDGVAVFFSTNAGTLDSQGIAQIADGNGIARDRLVTRQSAQVRARSGPVEEEVTVTVAGAPLVGGISLSCNPTQGTAPLTTNCTALVSSTQGNPLAGVTISVTVTPPGNTTVTPPFPETDASGQATFSVSNITQDQTTIAATSGSVVSDPSPIITILTP